MRPRWPLGAAALLAAGIGAAVLLTGPDHPAAAAQGPVADTAVVERGPLSAMVSQGGTLTYRARPDGSPYLVVNGADGVLTSLPRSGDRITCGDVLYRVDDRPIVLLCGPLPAYRALRTGDTGRDVRQLNRDLHVDGAGDTFTARTQAAVEALQRRSGAPVSGAVAFGQVVFLPEGIRVAKVDAQVGEPARPGAPILEGTSDTLQVQVSLDASQQGQVHRGDRAQITLPGNRVVRGRVEGFGRIAQAPAAQGSPAASATIPTFIRLDQPDRAHGLDRSPVDVDITTAGVDDALSVPVTALVGRAGGGYAVEVVRDGGRRELVGVRLGLFDTGGGRVQVEGPLRAGDSVVVPSI